MSELARIAVLIPCYNEEAAIAKVVSDFKATLPCADVYVYDNNSKDRTAEVARAAGAIVRSEMRRGKGNVVRRMFADVEADIYILVDGDDTYDATAAPALVLTLVNDGLDVVSGRRIAVGGSAYRTGHVIGNRLLTGLTVMMFRLKVLDLLTGYRVMSRRFVKSFPVTAEGFSIETELSVHAGRLLMPVAEVNTRYKERPHGSISKLHTWRDGLRILFAIAGLVREERPLVFFTAICAFLMLDWACPAFADCCSFDWVDASGLSFAGKRTDSRHSDAGTMGVETPGLSRRQESPRSKITVSRGSSMESECFTAARFTKKVQRPFGEIPM